MNSDLLERYCSLLSLLGKKFGATPELVNEIKGDFSSVSNLKNDMHELSHNLSLLDQAISENNKQGAVEAILLARVAVCNAENAYSNLAEDLETLAVELRDNGSGSQ